MKTNNASPVQLTGAVIQKIEQVASQPAVGRFKGKTVMVTGASSGIGQAVAKLFAKEGAQLVVVARRQERLEELKQELSKLYATPVACMVVDVANSSAATEAFKALPKEFSVPDILVNSAGLARSLKSAWETTPEDTKEMMETNLTGMANFIRLAVPLMKEKGSGHIFNIGSVAGIKPYANGAVYCASKAAVEAYTLSLREELVATPIRLTLISPGMVETEFSVVRLRDEEAAKKVYKGIKPMVANDIAQQILFAASAPAHVNIAHIESYPVHQASTTTKYLQP